MEKLLTKHTAEVKTKGRKPVGDSPMSAAERMRRSRSKLKEDGGTYFRVRVDGVTMEALGKAARGNELSQDQMLHFLFQGVLHRFLSLGLLASDLDAAGGSAADIDMLWAEHLFPTLPTPADKRHGDAK